MLHACFFIAMNEFHRFFDLMLERGQQQSDACALSHIWRWNDFDATQRFDHFIAAIATTTKTIFFQIRNISALSFL